MVQGATVDVLGLFGQLPEFLREPNPEIYLSDNYVVVDFETTVLEKGSPYEPNNSIVCASWRLGREHPRYTGDTKYHRGSEFEQHELLRDIEAADYWVAHNTKFEFGWLERCGLRLEGSLGFCTMLAEYVLLSNRSNPARLSLENCLSKRSLLPKEKLGKRLLSAQICPSTWPERWLRPYSLRDPEAGEALFLHQRRVLLEHGLLGVVFTRNILTPVLVSIEKNGMFLDPERAPIVQRKYRREISKISAELDKLTGGANPRSPPQMRKVIFEDLGFSLPRDRRLYTAKGEVKTGKEITSALKPVNKKQRRFIELKEKFAELNGALTKCLNKFVACIEETPDNILTATMNQAITVTQRLSSTGRNYACQFQNFARIFKPLFRARKPDWLMGEIDQAQLEYRVAVFLGQDAAGKSDILNKVDAHAFTAEHVFAGKWQALAPKSPEWDEMRTDAKSRTFKPLYGGEKGTKDEVRYYKAFKRKHKGITALQNRWKMETLNTKKLKTVTGLTFYFPGTRMLDDGYITNSTNICNYPVQSFATGDIVPIGVVYQWHLMRVAGLNSFLVNTVHDSTVGEVDPEEKEDYEEIGQFAHIDCVLFYLNDVYNIDFDVPLEVEAKFGTHWAEPKGWEEKFLQQEE